MPGAVDAWWDLHQRYGKLPWKDLFDPAIAYAEEGTPVTQNVAYYYGASFRRFNNPTSNIEEVANFNKVWAPSGRTPLRGRAVPQPGAGRDLSQDRRRRPRRLL